MICKLNKLDGLIIFYIDDFEPLDAFLDDFIKITIKRKKKILSFSWKMFSRWRRTKQGKKQKKRKRDGGRI